MFDDFASNSKDLKLRVNLQRPHVQTEPMHTSTHTFRCISDDVTMDMCTRPTAAPWLELLLFYSNWSVSDTKRLNCQLCEKTDKQLMQPGVCN